MDSIITLDELKNIIIERNNKNTSGLSEVVFEDIEVNFIYKKFKKHNRLDCTVWASIFPLDFKIWLDKKNCITKVPLSDMSKKERILGKTLLI